MKNLQEYLKVIQTPPLCPNWFFIVQKESARWQLFSCVRHLYLVDFSIG